MIAFVSDGNGKQPAVKSAENEKQKRESQNGEADRQFGGERERPQGHGEDLFVRNGERDREEQHDATEKKADDFQGLRPNFRRSGGLLISCRL